MAAPTKIIYSREFPPGNRIYICYECDSTSHALPLCTDILPEIFNKNPKNNMFFNFRIVLQKSQTKPWNCNDVNCLLYKSQEQAKFSRLASALYKPMPNEIKLMFDNPSNHLMTKAVESATQIEENNLEASVSFPEINHEHPQLVSDPPLPYVENTGPYTLDNTWVDENVDYENFNFHLHRYQDVNSLVFNHLLEFDPGTWREEGQYMPSEESHYGIFGEIQDEVSENETFVQIQN
ncbi:2276_t:CDS:2 [Gigaspora margarita]|uniref:2276_t:CDS:1 n=1 Tax=Gigaspora margarita TaxID=4874 RepID=A0ABN7UHM4_GIGMA|nr:2276_t:CDS:2 [Gigaspora margarita]